MHYLCYVYGPTTLEELNRVIAPYSDDESSGGICKQLVLLENIKAVTLETSLFDTITAFREIAGKTSYNKLTPILLVDDAEKYLDLSAIESIGAFVISYDLNEGEATCKMVVSRSFFDWYMVGGRWQGTLPKYVDSYMPCEVIPFDEISHEPDHRRGGTSLSFRNIDWETEKKRKVKQALDVWELVNPVTSHLPKLSDVFAELRVPPGAFYFRLNHEAFTQYYSDVHYATCDLDLSWENNPFTPISVTGMTRREVIRMALAKVYNPKMAIFFGEEFDHSHNGMIARTTALDFGIWQHPGDKEYKSLLRRIRKLSPDTVVTAIDMHN